MALDYQPVYLLASGMLLQERKLGVTTANLSNADTYGFKKDLLVAGAWYVDNGVRVNNTSPENPSNNFVYPLVRSISTDMSQGPLIQTNNKLDFAIEGEGFFTVTDGTNLFYTRKGNFKVDRDSYLVNDLGYRVLMEDGRYIRVVEDFNIDKEGYIYNNGEIVGRLAVVVIDNPVKVGRGMFTGNPVGRANYRLWQGFVERSNVDPVKEMINIIETSRAHEVYTRLIQSFDLIQSRVSRGLRA